MRARSGKSPGEIWCSRCISAKMFPRLLISSFFRESLPNIDGISFFKWLMTYACTCMTQILQSFHRTMSLCIQIIQNAAFWKMNITRGILNKCTYEIHRKEVKCRLLQWYWYDREQMQPKFLRDIHTRNNHYNKTNDAVAIYRVYLIWFIR